MNIHILAVDDDPDFLVFLKTGLQADYILSTASNLEEAEILIHAKEIDLVLLDIGLGNHNGLDFLKKMTMQHPELDIVMVTGHKDPKFAVEAIRSGARDYLSKPFDMEELIAVIEKNIPYKNAREKNAAYVSEINELSEKHFIVGQSPALLEVLNKANQVKGHMANLLIEGESGTGKELLARYVHRLDGNSRRPFIAVNCAAIPENLLESELFGHEKGSFTGAHQRK